jgi:hypothetical protein
MTVDELVTFLNENWEAPPQKNLHITAIHYISQLTPVSSCNTTVTAVSCYISPSWLHFRRESCVSRCNADTEEKHYGKLRWTKHVDKMENVNAYKILVCTSLENEASERLRRWQSGNITTYLKGNVWGLEADGTGFGSLALQAAIPLSESHFKSTVTSFVWILVICRYSDGLWDGRSGFDSRKGEEIFP